MAITGFSTYHAAAGTGGDSNHEDLMDLVTIVAREETPLFSELPKSPVKDTYTEWLTDSLATATKENAKIEGADFSFSQRAARTRVGNYTQIFEKTVEVTESQRAANPAGVDDEFNYQVDLAMREIARDVEEMIINGTANAGASGTARESKGIVSFVATNVETGTGTGDEALTETMYQNLLQTIYAAGGRPDYTYANAWQKRKIDSFSTPNTRYQDGTNGSLNASVGIYQSSFGIQRIVLHWAMPTDTVLALERKRFAVGVFRPIAYTDVAKVADAKRGAIVGELTLKSLNEAASGKITGLSTS